jgi:hypothetical protein
MSFLTKSVAFEPSEDSKFKNAVHATIAARRFQKKNTPSIHGQAWYFDGIARDRQGYSTAAARKNELTQKMSEHATSDKTWYMDNGEDSFYEDTDIREYISKIPFMTYGLQYVLELMKIEYISQMLAEFIKHMNDYVDDKEVMNIYFRWLKSITEGTIAEETNINSICMVMAKYAEHKGLYEYPY